MTSTSQLDVFAENLRQDVLALAESEDDGLMLADSFTETVFEILSEAGEFEDPLVCYHRAHGMEVSGYGIDEEEGRLDLFLSIHTNEVPPPAVTRSQVEVGFRRLRSFLEWCLAGKYAELAESSPVFDMAAHVYSFRRSLARVRMIVITDGRTRVDNLHDERIADVTASKHLWDIIRLHQVSTSGRQRETVSIDLNERFGWPLPCLRAETSQEGYRAFLTLIPGHMLRTIYSEFGSRVLERNVRSFLQARGKVNRGIRDTILKEPDRFLAYNNGITLTAESVELCQENGGEAIARMVGLQIVNGGQTTASLLATSRGLADLSQVSVAAKLIEVESGDVHDELVRNVSRYANSQNRIAEADFSANDPFHVRIEDLSRTIWAPPAAGTQMQTKWFYERARGQYQDAKAAESTPARRKRFAAENPTRQRFTKTDLAKFENTWAQLPHIVSRGAQKNFSDYMIRLSGRDKAAVDRDYFERLIGKAILFRSAERIVQQQNFGGYRANIVTYTIALLSHAATQRIDLLRIWREQALTESLRTAIAEFSHEVHGIITSPPTARNITEWCKSERCWEAVRSNASRGPARYIAGELLGLSATRDEQKKAVSELSADYVNNLEQVVKLSSERWGMLAQWGAETGAIDPGQRQLALKIGRAMSKGRDIKPPEAEEAVEILGVARSLGFEV